MINDNNDNDDDDYDEMKKNNNVYYRSDGDDDDDGSDANNIMIKTIVMIAFINYTSTMTKLIITLTIIIIAFKWHRWLTMTA